MSGQKKRKLSDLKLDVKRKPGRRRGRWRRRKRFHRFYRYLFAPLFILSWDEVALLAQVS